MNAKREHKQCFPLRLPLSVKKQAIDLAFDDGISLNQFISQAVVEKITRAESPAHHPPAGSPQSPSLPVKASTRKMSSFSVWHPLSSKAEYVGKTD
ncbi:MAG TPA: toxin-antitoxin system HicB family antitoxin [Terriglobales bacterium]|nr:toxin-antitoxin system HicB family antitoxin [Terriglobales bacterium]